MKSLEVNIIPSIAPIDFTFRYYEPEQSHYSVVLPQFIQLNQPGVSVVISDPECAADIMPETNYITISGTSEEAMNMTPITLFVYGDVYKSELLATCRIEIHARPVIYTRARLNTQAQHTLTLPALNARSIRYFSNKPTQVKPMEMFANEPMKLVPQSLNHVNVIIKITDPQASSSPTLVNCVDYYTNELVYSWLLLIETVV